MAISDKIESIENHLKADYNSIEKLVDVNVDKNIENIASLVDSIYDKFPKTDYAEGSNITLSNTLKGKLDFENDIVGYGQTSQKNYQGYNLLNLSNKDTILSGTHIVINNGIISLDGTASSGNTYIQNFDNFYLEAGTYTMHSTISGNSSIQQQFALYNDNTIISNIIYNANVSEAKQTFTLNERTQITRVRFWITNGTVNTNFTTKIQLEPGSTAHNWEPYVGGIASPNPSYPQDIEVVRGKNRLKPITIDRTIKGVKITSNDNGKITIKGTATDSINEPIWGSWGGSNVLCELPQGSYVSSGLGTNSPRLNIVANGTTTIFTGNSTRTLTNTAKITGIFLYINNGESVDMTFEPMIEKGSQATSYLPYNTIGVKARGNNLLDKTQVVGNNTATTVTQINTGFRVSAETLGYAGVTTIDVKANTNYFLKFNTNVIVDSGVQKYVRIFAGTTQTTTIATYTFTEGGGTFNTGNNTKINIWFYCSLGGSGTVDYTNVQLEEGSTATDYEPYVTPQVKQLFLGNFKPSKIGNYKDYFYRTSGKNLFDNSVERKNAYIGASGSDIGTTITYYNSSATYSYVNCAYVEAGKTYTLSWKQSTTPASTNLRVGAIVDNNNIILNTQNTWTNSSTSITFTPNVSGYLVLCTDINATNIQLEIGNTATDFNPYGSGEWYFKGKINNKELNGSETWALDINYNRFASSTTITDYDISNRTSALCSHYKYDGTPYFALSGSGNYLFFGFPNENTTTLETWEAWLSTNKPSVFYIKAIPTDTKITDTTMITQLEDIYNLMSYTGTTIIEINGQLPLIIKVRALKGN